MKRVALYVFTIMLLVCMAASATETNFDGKLGGAYSSYPEMPGFDISADYQWVLDPYFSAGFETGLFWVQWEQQRGEALVGQSRSDLKATTNAYVIPMLAIAQVRLPNLKEKFMVLPYMTVGLGFSVMPLTYSDPAYDNAGIHHDAQDKFYFHKGFTWKLAVGAAYTPSGSNLAFIGETGYVGSHLYSGNNDIDMSRVFIDLGVRFTFGR